MARLAVEVMLMEILDQKKEYRYVNNWFIISDILSTVHITVPRAT